jgi:MFS family permease
LVRSDTIAAQRAVEGELVRRSGVVASAIVAILGSVVSILLGAMMVLGWAALRAAPETAARPAPPPAALLLVLALVYCGFGAWGITSAIGALLQRNWARICFLAFGGLLAFFSFCAAAGCLLVAIVVPSAGPLPDNVSADMLRAMFAVGAAVSLVCFAIGTWWLIYFSRPAIRSSFTGEAGPAAPRRLPVVVSIVAWLLIAGGVICAVEMFFPYPILVFGFVLRGLTASLLLAVFAAVGLTAGIGMLKKRVEAHSLAVGLFGFGILNTVSLIAVPGALVKMQDVMRETQGSQALPPGTMSSIMMSSAFVGVIVATAIVILLMKARKPFLEACRLPVE